jgi:RNA polymerase sigma-70 factor (ECF subfamily)
MSEIVTKNFLSLIADNKESDAYRFLYNQYHSTLLQFAIAYLKSKEPAEEIVNDVLYRVWIKKEAIAEIKNLRVYLFTAVRNTCLTYISKSKKEQDFSINMSMDECASETPENLIITKELQQLIKQTINALPPRCKQIYEMIRVEGLRNKDVAETLKISVNTIDVQLAVALKRLVQTVNTFNQKKDLSKKV